MVGIRLDTDCSFYGNFYCGLFSDMGNYLFCKQKKNGKTEYNTERKTGKIEQLLFLDSLHFLFLNSYYIFTFTQFNAIISQKDVFM